MANNLGNYNPVFYAQEALILLYKALGMANRVHRGYEQERKELGDTIAIKKPSTFVAQDAPGNNQDVATDKTTIVLNQWKEVRFALTDKELAYTGKQIIADHITPAVYALADLVDQQLLALGNMIPTFTGTAGTTMSAVSDITNARKQLFNQKVPLSVGMIHMVIDGNAEANLLALPAFSQWQGAGDQGVSTQMRGSLGTKFGLEISANQNVPTRVSGTSTATALTMNGASVAGATSIGLKAGAVTGSLVAGDIIKISGDTQAYAIQNTVAAAGNAFAAVSIFPPLKLAVADNTAVTLTMIGGSGASHVDNLAFHRNAFALACAPLPDFYDGQGVRVFTAADPFTGLAVRARTWAEGKTSTFNVCLDILFGVQTLDANLATRVLG